MDFYVLGGTTLNTGTELLSYWNFHPIGISQTNQKLIEIPNSKEFDFSGKMGEPQVSPYKILMDSFESLINYFNQVFLINLFKRLCIEDIHTLDS